MENQEPTPSNALAKTSKQPACSTEELVRQRVTRLAELIRKDGAPYPLTSALVNIWVDVFLRVQIPSEQIAAAFDKAERGLRFWPAPTEVLGFVSTAENNSAEEKAAQKWQEVRDYIRLHYHPDLAPSGPRISERTRRAINAAGGLAYLSECTGESRVFARKRFIEAWLRWDELKQDEYLLPDSEVKSLLSGVAATKALPDSFCFNDLHARGPEYAEKAKLLSAWEVAEKELPDIDHETRQQIEAELSEYGRRFAAALQRHAAGEGARP